MVIRLILIVTALLVGPLASAGEIVVSNRPLHSLVSGVLAGITTPQLLLSTSQSIHAQQMKPSQISLAREAKRVFWLGPEIEPELVPFAGPHWLDLSSVPDLLWRPLRAWGDGHDTTAHSRDPHLWLDPTNGQALVRAIATESLSFYPEQVVRIETNTHTSLRQLEQLDRSIAARLTALSPKGYAVSHDAYQYFEARYALSPYATLSREPHGGTSAFRVRIMAEGIANAQVACLFTEPALNSRVLQRLAAEYAIPVITLDPLGSTLPAGPNLYGDLLTSITDGFSDCFQTTKP